MSNSTYSFSEHAHRYACWTAARAASISRFSNAEVSGFIEAVKLREHIDRFRQQSTLSNDVFRTWFVATAEQLVECMHKYEPKQRIGKPAVKRTISFGIAAKMIAIYIKTYEVLPSGGQSALAAVAYPPIDSILIGNLPKEWNIDKSIRWSQLDKDKFMTLLDAISKHFGDQPWWKLELYWKSDRNNITTETNDDDEQ